MSAHLPAVHDLPTSVLPGGRFSQWSARACLYALCDVDGTLIGAEHDASDRVVTAVRRAEQAGIRVGIATGRMRTSVGRLRQQLPASGPHVFHNGAEYQHGDLTASTATLSPHDVDTLLTLVRQRDDCYLEVCVTDGLYLSAYDLRAAPHWEMLGVDPIGVLPDAHHLAGQTAVKATLVAFGVSTSVLDELTGLVTDCGLAVGAAHSPRTPGLFYLNITHPDASKGTAARKAAELLAVSLDEVAAIGDGLNDLPLFKEVGTAIAMGQAPAEVVANAHLVVPSVDEDGAAVALEMLTGWSVVEHARA